MHDAPFATVASIDYPVIDADAHVYEPPGLWQERIPAGLRARAPKVTRTATGDVWTFNEGERERNVGLMAAAGASYLGFRPSGLTYDDIRPGNYDVAARLADMDADGIAVQLLYPSVCEEGARIFGDDRTLQLACVRAYNEWVRDFCRQSPRRLYAHAVIPATSTEDAVAELEWALKEGFPGVLISLFPSGSAEPSAADDPFWARAH